MRSAEMDCRYFTGYKPCDKNDICSTQCPHYAVAEPRILVIHLDALGAVLRGTVLLRAIKEKWPKAHITWVTAPHAAPLLENNRFIDRLLKNDHLGALSLKALSFDYGFCVDKSLAAAGLLTLPKEIK